MGIAAAAAHAVTRVCNLYVFFVGLSAMRMRTRVTVRLRVRLRVRVRVRVGVVSQGMTITMVMTSISRRGHAKHISELVPSARCSTCVTATWLTTIAANWPAAWSTIGDIAATRLSVVSSML